MKNVQREISVIGLGTMGSALVRPLLSHGYRVTVWNRTSAKAETLVRDGGVLAHSPAAALEPGRYADTCSTKAQQ